MTEIGHYRILRSLGRGGMGEVFLARDMRLRREVALKMLPPDVENDPERVQRFIREAHAASRLSHPSIAVVHEIDSDGGRHFIAMEYVEGENLAEAIARRRFDTPEKLRIATEIADALDEAHVKGVVHRDLKPSNVMVTKRGHAKILDFGLAKVGSSETGVDSDTAMKSREGTIVGTAQYMSPEQALGREVDGRSDIFSFGLLLHELLSGRRPFNGRNSNETLARILHEPPEALEIDDPNEAELRRIVGKCLEKSPDLRYQSARDLAVDLQRLQQASSQPRSAPAPELSSNVRAAPGWGGRRAAIAAITLVALVIAAVIVVRRAKTPSAIDSLVVIPFTQSGLQPQEEYLADGLSDEVIDSLARLPGLRVISRTTALRYKGRSLDPRSIGEELSVRALLTGELRAREGRITLQTELIDTADGSRISGGRYSGTAADVLSLHRSIIDDVTRSLHRDVDRAAIVTPGTVDPEAFRLYMKGRHYWNKRTHEGHRRAIAEFRAAIDRDPTFAQAYVGLADSYLVAVRYTDLPSHELLALVEPAARRALELDPRLGEVHATLGHLRAQQWRWPEAEAEFRKAIEMRPAYPSGHHWYALMLLTLGRDAEAVREIDTAQALDPLSPVITMATAVVRYVTGDRIDARRRFERTLEINPQFPSALLWLGLVDVVDGRCDDGIARLKRAAELAQGVSEDLGTLAFGYGRCGRRDEAEALIRQLEERRAKGWNVNIALALALPGVGRRDEAIGWLERAAEERDPNLAATFYRPQLTELESDPRVQAVRRRMGVPSGRSRAATPAPARP